MSTDAWSPAQYEKFKAERAQPFYDLMALVQPMCQANIIDLGCGTGEWTAVLHNTLHAQQTLGMDSSGEMLEKAKSFKVDGQIDFIEADLQSWVPTQKYDLIFSNATLQWCTDHPSLFQKWKKSLTSQGQFAFQIPINQDYPTHTLAQEMSLESPWKNQLGEGGGEGQRDVLSPAEYAKLLFTLGFSKQSVTTKVYGHVLDSRESVLDWVKGTTLNRFKSRLSSADYNDFLNKYRHRLFQILPDEKPFFYPFKRIFIWGQL